MSRKIYRCAARIIATAITGADDIRTQAAIADVARQLADMSKHDDPAFRSDLAEAERTLSADATTGGPAQRY